MKEKNILVIDDDRIILDSLCEFLSLEGFQTTGAETLADALTELRQNSFSATAPSTAPSKPSNAVPMITSPSPLSTTSFVLPSTAHCDSSHS
jgi:CheY-like chemotaxis protein